MTARPAAPLMNRAPITKRLIPSAASTMRSTRAPVEAVGEGSGDRPDEEVGTEVERQRDPDPGCRSRQLVHRETEQQHLAHHRRAVEERHGKEPAKARPAEREGTAGVSRSRAQGLRRRLRHRGHDVPGRSRPTRHAGAYGCCGCGWPPQRTLDFRPESALGGAGATGPGMISRYSTAPAHSRDSSRNARGTRGAIGPGADVVFQLGQIAVAPSPCAVRP